MFLAARKWAALAFAMGLVAATTAVGAVVYVDDDALNDPGPGDTAVSDPGEDGSADHPFDAIQEGIDAALADDTVILLPGTYTGAGNRDLDYRGKPITVRSTAPDNPLVVAATIIDVQGTAANRHRGFHFHSGETAASVMDGVTVTGGYGPRENLPDAFASVGGAIYCQSSSPTIRRCRIVANTTTDDSLYGGAVYCLASDVIIEDCILEDNNASAVRCGYGGAPAMIGCSIRRNRPGGIRSSRSASPLIASCIIGDNQDATLGGGIACADSSATIVNCIIQGNEAVGVEPAPGRGAGIYFGGSSATSTVTNCLIVGNTSQQDGGGICCMGGSITVTNCTIVANEAMRGGGVYSAATVVISNCILHGNTLDQVAGPATVSYSAVQGGSAGTGNISADPLFVNPGGSDGIVATFEDNDYRLAIGSPCIDAGDNESVPGDTADLDGDEDTAEPTPVDLDGWPRMIDAPWVAGTGHPPGAPAWVDMGAYESPAQRFVILGDPVTVAEGAIPVGGQAKDGIGAFLVRLTAPPEEPLSVTVAHHAGDPDISVFIGAALTFDAANYATYQAVIPAAAEDDDWMIGKATLRVSAPGVPSVDVTAIEEDNDPVPPFVHVRADAGGANNGSSWTDAFTELQQAIVASTNRIDLVQEIWVASGVYRPDYDPISDTHTGDRTATFHLPDELPLYGGFAGWETQRGQRDWRANAAILSGDLAGNDVPDLPEVMACFSGAGVACETGCEGFDLDLDGDVDAVDLGIGENSYHVTTGSDTTSTALLDGFTITAGHANAPWGGFPNDAGGGMRNDGGSPTIRNCRFTGNWGRASGAIDVNDSSLPMLAGCTFLGNYGQFRGGAISIWSNSQPTIVDCLFERNATGLNSGYGNAGGGAIHVRYSHAALANCRFVGNRVRDTSPGGAICSVSDSLILVNCLFSGNEATGRGGAVYQETGTTVAVNCTLAANSAADLAGGIYAQGGTLTVRNSILWGNSDSGPLDASAQIAAGTAGLAVTHSCVQDEDADDAAVFPGAGNIDVDPFFADADGIDNHLGTSDDNLRFITGSPCDNTGDNAALLADTADLDADGDTLEPTPLDLDRLPRIIGGVVNMGAYESPDTDGDGAGDVIDECPGTLMGAPVDEVGCPVVAADLDRDGDVDQADFGHLQRCLSGPGVPPENSGCARADVDADNDVDQDDRMAFQYCMSGADVVADPLCQQ